MKSFWYFSSFVLIITSCNFFICNKTQVESTANQKVVSSLFDTLNLRKFKTRIKYKTTEITGILICKKINDSTLAGCFINEFGIKGFDFTLTQSRAKLDYVFKSLDKWYIRKILETDLHFLFSNPKLESTCSINDTSAYVAKLRYSLHYVYYFTDDNRMEHADMYKGKDKVASMKQTVNEQKGIVISLAHIDGSLNYEFCEINNKGL